MLCTGLEQTIHVIDPFPIPSYWRRFRVVDFRYTNPFVCQWWAVDQDGRMYRYRKIYAQQAHGKVHAARSTNLAWVSISGRP